eukprot:CAMPEP_0119573492 /NCGR_PEP_ID=MMETSP1352-20130426/45147_1 /TAXON_ID=265584 /ORGANISM="Stauroneis constricta, Strain CCMP1120" /LENGTH=725 /DNA_ID=CAMNT_0007623181 /DNA_START=147 /DNA_END=2325 /DNA_ORIENTATION=-
MNLLDADEAVVGDLSQGRFLEKPAARVEVAQEGLDPAGDDRWITIPMPASPASLLQSQRQQQQENADAAKHQQQEDEEGEQQQQSQQRRSRRQANMSIRKRSKLNAEKSQVKIESRHRWLDHLPTPTTQTQTSLTAIQTSPSTTSPKKEQAHGLALLHASLKRWLRMSEESIDAVLKQCPYLSDWDFRTELEPRLQWLQQRLFLRDERLGSVLTTNPSLLKYNPDRNLEPTLRFFQVECMDDDWDKTRAFVLSDTSVLGASLNCRLRLRLHQFLEPGLPRSLLKTERYLRARRVLELPLASQIAPVPGAWSATFLAENGHVDCAHDGEVSCCAVGTPAANEEAKYGEGAGVRVPKRKAANSTSMTTDETVSESDSDLSSSMKQQQQPNSASGNRNYRHSTHNDHSDDRHKNDWSLTELMKPIEVQHNEQKRKWQLQQQREQQQEVREQLQQSNTKIVFRLRRSTRDSKIPDRYKDDSNNNKVDHDDDSGRNKDYMMAHESSSSSSSSSSDDDSSDSTTTTATTDQQQPQRQQKKYQQRQQQQQQQQQRNQSHLAISSTIFKSYPPRMEELAKKTARLVTNDKNGMKPTWRDVICGRTHMPISATWPANLFFHHLLQVHQKQYDASQHKKKQFAVIVRDNILVLGGTFLEWDKHMKCWNELEDKRSLQKTTQAFRDTRKSPKRLPLDKLIVKKLQDLQTDDEEGNDNDDNDNESAASHGSSSAGSA